MRSALPSLLLLLLGACATGAPGATGGDDDPAAPDAAATPPDAAGDPPPDAAGDPPPDAADDPPPLPQVAPLLLTEVTLAPTGAEMIEIGNPTDAPVALDDYFVADVGVYFRLPAGAAAPASTDFIARFPAGSTIAPGDVVVVALDSAAAFTAATGETPDWSLGDGTMLLVAGAAPTLTNAGELVALFHWDGASDTVTDVDLLLAGVPSAANGLVAKTAPYADESGALPAQTATPGPGVSTKRVLLPGGHQVAGGNGIDGADETSEDTRVTWDSTFTAPTPGTTALPL